MIIYKKYTHIIKKLDSEKDLYDMIQCDPDVRLASNHIHQKYSKQMRHGFSQAEKIAYQKLKLSTMLSVGISFKLNRSDKLVKEHGNMVFHTGLLNLDVDDPAESDKLIALWDSGDLKKDSLIRASWRSVSGHVNGSLSLVIAVEVPTLDRLDSIQPGIMAQDVHKLYHKYASDYIQATYGVKAGHSSDLVRVRLINHDPDIYYNMDSDVLSFDCIEQELKDQQKTSKRHSKKTKREKSGVLTEHASLLNSFLVGLEGQDERQPVSLRALRAWFDQVIEEKRDVVSEHGKWLRFALLCVQDREFGRYYFDEISKLSGGYDHKINHQVYDYLEIREEERVKRLGEGEEGITLRSACYLLGDLLSEESINMPEDGAYTLKSGQYISDIMTSSDMDKQKVLIASVPNTGKTRAILDKEKSILVSNEDIIYISPTVELTRQKAASYGLTEVCGGSELKLDPEGRYSATYDSLPRLCDFLRTTEGGYSTFSLIIDEAHQIVESYGFRKRAIDGVVSVINNFKRVILLSGTPFPLKGWSWMDDVFVYKIYKEGCVKKKARFLHYMNDAFFAMMEHRASRQIGRSNRTDFIYINDKSRADKYARILREMYGLKVSVYHSVSDNLEEKVKIRTQGEIDASVDVVITTSYLSEGIDISMCRVGCVYIFTANNALELIQFSSRFRNKLPEDVLIMKLDESSEKKKNKSKPIQFSGLFHVDWIKKDCEKIINTAIHFMDGEPNKAGVFEDLCDTVLRDRGDILSYSGGDGENPIIDELGVLLEKSRRFSKSCFLSVNIMKKTLSCFDFEVCEDVFFGGYPNEGEKKERDAISKSFNKERKENKILMLEQYLQEIRTQHMTPREAFRYIQGKSDVLDVSGDYGEIIELCAEEYQSAYTLLKEVYESSGSIFSLKEKLRYFGANFRLTEASMSERDGMYLKEDDVHLAKSKLLEIAESLFSDKDTYTSTEIHERVNSHYLLRGLLLRGGRDSVTKHAATKFFKYIFSVSEGEQFWVKGGDGERDRNYTILSSYHFEHLDTIDLLKLHLIEKKQNVIIETAEQSTERGESFLQFGHPSKKDIIRQAMFHQERVVVHI